MVLPSNTPPRTDGIGKMWFAGVDITQAPYYAGLTTATQYWLLDGYTSTQFTTGPDSLGISRAYPKDWVIHVVINSIAPDRSRQTLMRSIIALNELFDPTQGPQQLVLAEFPGSYWVAQNQGSKLDNEAVSPQMFEADIDFACTGPAYSVTESATWATMIGAKSAFLTLTSNGDVKAGPIWTFYNAGNYPYVGTITIKNITNGQQISWSNVEVGDPLNFGDRLDFILDPDYGTKYTILLNGTTDVTEGASGSSWPYLDPGVNNINFLIAPNTTGYTITSGLWEVKWRDRFKAGATAVALYTAPTTPRLPTGVSLDVVDTPGVSDSYTCTGTAMDIFNNPLAGFQINLGYTTGSGGWFTAQTTTTASDGSFAFNPTPVSAITEFWACSLIGDATHFDSSSIVYEAIPIGSRLNTAISMSVDDTNAPDLVFTGTLALALNFPAVPLPLKKIYLNMIPDVNGASIDTTNAGSWTNAPGLEPAITEMDGSYRIEYTAGPGATSYRAYFPDDPTANGCLASSPYTTVGMPPWPAVLPGPIEYYIFCAPQLITTGYLDYFAACGYTHCGLVCESDALTANKLYTTQLATILAAGMTPALDIEGVQNASGTPWKLAWQDSDQTQFATWFAAMAAAGWPTVSSEHTYSGNHLPTNQVPYARNFFSGYIPFDIIECVGGIQWCGWALQRTAFNSITTQNLLEFYYNTDVGYIEQTITASLEEGIPIGLLGYPDQDYDIGGSVYNNSVGGGAPSYQSMFDWAYSNGLPLNAMAVWLDPNFVPSWLIEPEYYALFYLDNHCDSVISGLQQTYPPAGTAALNYTKIAPNASFNVTNTGGLNYTMSATLNELISGIPIPNAQVHLQVNYQFSETGVADWTDVTSTATTDYNGNVSWPVTLTPGVANYRVKYVGAGNYLNTFAPYSRYGDEVQVYGAGTTATSMALATVPSQPFTGQAVTFTATLTSGGTPLSGKNVVCIYNHPGADEGAIPYMIGTYVTNVSGQVSFTYTPGVSTYDWDFIVTFYGDTTYATSSNTLTFTVT